MNTTSHLKKNAQKNAPSGIFRWTVRHDSMHFDGNYPPRDTVLYAILRQITQPLVDMIIHIEDSPFLERSTGLC